MPKKRFGVEQIVKLLRQIEVSMVQRKIDQTCLPGSRYLGTELLPLVNEL